MVVVYLFYRVFPFECSTIHVALPVAITTGVYFEKYTPKSTSHYKISNSLYTINY